MSSEEEKRKPTMESSLTFSLKDESGQERASGEAKGLLEEESISILPKSGETLYLSYRDILEISEGDYKIHLTLTSKEELTLFDLGYRYEDFLRNLYRLRNEVLLKDMLMHEAIRKSGVEAEFTHLDENGKELEKGTSEVRLYETALVIIPQKGEFIRIPYSGLVEMHAQDYTFSITRESGEKFIFSQMGRQFDPFKKMLSDAVNEMALKAQLFLKELLPEANPSILRQIARFMRDGRAAQRRDIESVSKELWGKLEKRLEVLEIKEEYDFLKPMALEDQISIGFKRGLLGDLTGEYIWFLIPICGQKLEEAGNAIAMEAGSDEGGGRATYFFRIMSRKDYKARKNVDDLNKEIERFVKRINRCMIDINFRREPIYLPDERLEEPENQKYKFAIQKVPSLRMLRQLFIGRVIHSSPEQWQKDVMDLLRFNASTEDDNLKWSKGRD